MAKDNIQWHPAFVAAIELEFKEYSQYLEYIKEHELTQKPLKIDLVVIKKLKDIQIEKRLGKILRKYNIFEYKSPTDYLSIEDYYKVKSYAYLYKVLSRDENKEEIDLEEMTISLTSTKYPRDLLKYLKSRDMKVRKENNGIYYIEGTDITTQILVVKQLGEEESKYLSLLQSEHEDKKLLSKVIEEYLNNYKDNRYEIIVDVLRENNPNELMEVYKSMGVAKLNNENIDFLLDTIKKFNLDQKLKEEGKIEGKIEGIKVGIKEGEEKEREEGRQRNIRTAKKLLAKRFRLIPSEINTKIEKASIEELEAIMEEVLDLEKIEDVLEYL